MNYSTNSRQNRLTAINTHLRTISNALRDINNLLEGMVDDEVEDDDAED
jgi:hypothetical protein